MSHPSAEETLRGETASWFGAWFWFLFGVLVWFEVACILFPSSCCVSFLFNDDLALRPHGSALVEKNLTVWFDNDAVKFALIRACGAVPWAETLL